MDIYSEYKWIYSGYTCQESMDIQGGSSKCSPFVASYGVQAYIVTSYGWEVHTVDVSYGVQAYIVTSYGWEVHTVDVSYGVQAYIVTSYGWEVPIRRRMEYRLI